MILGFPWMGTASLTRHGMTRVDWIYGKLVGMAGRRVYFYPARQIGVILQLFLRMGAR